MATLSPGQIAGVLVKAGWPKQEIPLAIAIVLGESGGRTDAIGDTTLTNAKWGPSIGLFQIRSINAERGKGTTRDELANADPLINAQHALIIRRSQGFGAWTVYNTRAYAKYLAKATIGAATPIPWTGSSQIGLPDIPLPNIPNPLEGLKEVRDLIQFVTDRRNWIRVSMFMAGLALLVIGVWAAAFRSNVMTTARGIAVKTGAAIATKKKVTK